MTSQIIINIIISFSIFALVAISFSLIYQTTRFFHFAHAIIFTSGAYFVEGRASGYWFLVACKNNNKIAVQIDIDTYEKLEELLENYALVQLMKEEDSEKLEIREAKEFYKK